jgi:hypothetical protein
MGAARQECKRIRHDARMILFALTVRRRIFRYLYLVIARNDFSQSGKTKKQTQPLRKPLADGNKCTIEKLFV